MATGRNLSKTGMDMSNAVWISRRRDESVEGEDETAEAGEANHDHNSYNDIWSALKCIPFCRKAYKMMYSESYTIKAHHMLLYMEWYGHPKEVYRINEK